MKEILNEYRLLPFILVICSFMVFSCKDEKPTQPEENKGTLTETQLIVDEFILPSGETAEYSSGFEIIAANKIDIAGDLIIKADKPGDFVIRCMNGDAVISGTLIVQNDTAQNNGSKIISGTELKKTNEAEKGTSIAFFFVNNTLQFTRTAKVIAGNGKDAIPSTIVGIDEKFEAEKGGTGGDINIVAKKLILPKLQAGDPSLFTLGNGGSGSDVTIDRVEFTTQQSHLNILAGHGGVSGHLTIDAEEIEGLPTVQDISADIEYVSGGIGGKGGNILWENTEDPIIPGSTGQLNPIGDDDRFPALESFVLFGGWGGSGAVEGGKGGFAGYWSGRIIRFTVPQKKAPSVSVIGGNGGEVFYSPLPIFLALGGQGGEFMVLGNYGQPGNCSDKENCYPDGADGGDVEGIGGNGGSVHDDVLFYSAVGGDGGNCEISRTQIPATLELFGNRSPSAYEAGYYGVVSGAGGWGADRNDGCPGGDGGKSGSLRAIGGDGGNVPARTNTKGGDGGDVWTRLFVARDLQDVRLWMRGGDGNPPGEKGCNGSSVTSTGTGGHGFLPGENGTYLGFASEGEVCGEEGILAGENLTCEDDGGGRDDCNDTSYYTAKVVIERDFIDSCCTFFQGDCIDGRIVYYKEITVNGWNHRYKGGSATNATFREYSERCGIVLVDTTYSVNFPPGASNPMGIFIGALCVDGELQWTDEGDGIVLYTNNGTTKTTYTSSGGCFFSPEVREQYYCCFEGDVTNPCRE